VQADSPGAKAGLRTGDVITELDGKAIGDSGQLQALVSQKSPGDTIHLELIRDEKQTSADVTLADLSNKEGSKETAGSEHGKGRWGLNLGDLTPDLRNQLNAPAQAQGAIVEDVVPGSPADNAGISRGDVIIEVDRKPMKSVSDVAQALGSVPKGQDALVLVWSNGGTTFRVLRSAE